MGTRPFLCFPTFQTLDYRLSKKVQANPCGFIRNNKKGALKRRCQVSLKYMEPEGRGNDLKVVSFLQFSSECRFLKFKENFLQGIMGKIQILL